MSWIEFQIHTTNEAIEPVTHLLYETGIQGVEIDEGRINSDDMPTYVDELGQIMPIQHTNPHHPTIIKAYLPQNEQADEKIINLQRSITALQDLDIYLGDLTFHTVAVHEEDWATSWEQYYKPIHVTKHMTVTPTWEAYERTSDDEIVIELDPGMAFGTGTHETTMLCMQALETYVENGDRIIDIGCGSGILSITSAKLGAKHIFAYDLDEVAVKSTRENISINHVEDQITVKHQDLLTDVHEQVDLVVSNILADVIMKVTPDVHTVLKKQGIFIASGIIDAKLEEVTQVLEQNNFTVLEVHHDGHWVSVVSKK